MRQISKTNELNQLLDQLHSISISGIYLPFLEIADNKNHIVFY